MNTSGKNQVLVMAPAGSFAALSAALQAGADAVYFGVGNLNMRSRAADNFTVADLLEVVRQCHAKQAQAYLTLNIIVYDSEITAIRELCDAAKAADVDAVIAGDFAVMAYARQIGLTLHASVQCNIANFEAAKFYAQFVDTVVLARELTLPQIRNITRQIREQNLCGPNGKLLQVELFAHGALCVAWSGKCGMSLAVYNTSANRGNCYQVCRRRYRVIDEQNGSELVLDNEFVMSPKDLCTISFLPQILDAGVTILKLEGRGRSADYVATVTQVYREVVTKWQQGDLPTLAQYEQYEKRLQSVFNRGFWQGGYYLGKQLGEWSNAAGNQASVRKIYLGEITNYYQKLAVAELRLTTQDLTPPVRLLAIGPTTGAIEFDVTLLHGDNGAITVGRKGEKISFKCAAKLRENDRIYLLEKASGNI